MAMSAQAKGNMAMTPEFILGLIIIALIGIYCAILTGRDIRRGG